MSSQLIVQWNYIIYFHIRGSFFLFALIVGYVDIKTYQLTKYYYIIERVYFIYRLFILFISTFSFLLFLYTVSWRYKRDYLHASIDILFYIMFFIINTKKKCWTLLYHVHICDTKKVPIWTWPLSPLFVATPLCTVHALAVVVLFLCQSSILSRLSK